MRCWCVLVGLIALAVSSLTSEEPLESTNDDPENTDLPVAEELVSDGEYYDDGDYYDDELLPDPEALTEGENADEEVVVLDENTRIVAEALIQELDQISSRLVDQDDGRQDSATRVSPSDVRHLEKVLERAGLTPNSPLMQSLMHARAYAVPAEALGPEMKDIATELSEMMGMPPNSSPQKPTAERLQGPFRQHNNDQLNGLPPKTSILTPGMTKKNVEEIKRELKLMLFGPDRPVYSKRPINGQSNRRQDGRRRPTASNRQKQRQPPVTAGGKIQQRQQQAQNRPPARTPIPIFLRPPRPAGVSGPTGPVKDSVPHEGRLSEGARQPINEFRPPSSDFRLPESPFRQTVASTNFNPPQRNTFNNGNLQQGFRPSGAPPAQSSRINSAASSPRPSEEEFGQSLLGNRERFPPTTVKNVPFHTTRLPAKSPPSSRPQQPPPQLRPTPSVPLQTPPGRPVLGGGILAQSNFDASPTQQPPRTRIVKPECDDIFADGVCLEAHNYPEDIITNYLSRHRPALETMLAEVRSQSADDLVDGVSASEETKYSYSHYYGNRRQGEDTHAHRDFAEDGGFLCPSEVKYARPQLAQTSRGVWKYIINSGEHTQTLRMERCLKPSSGCSYVSPHYKSHCIQVYNYHRLLSFDDAKGMHVDIYKIPVGCSCHVQGYAYLYPPLSNENNGHIIPPAFPTDVSGNLGGNALGPNNRKTTSESRESPIREPYKPTFEMPPGMKDFSSFLDQQFGSHFGGLTSGSSSSFRRTDAGGAEEPSEAIKRPPPNSQRLPAASKTGRKPSRTNYDYHPIIDFFGEKS